MQVPQSFVVAKQRMHHKRRSAAVATVPPLVLASAVYDPDEQTLVLGFDRAVNIAAFDGTQVVVQDGQFNAQTFDGEGGASLLDASTVRISLGVTGAYGGEGVTMNASGASGIVASDDGGTWSGVTDLGLPFP
jgi:hypothetical protein